jgi:signal transduction histidine kinase
MRIPNRARGGVGEDRSRRLVDIGTSLLSELNLESVLPSVVEAARELTGARYAGLGVLGPEGEEFERFVSRGIDDETRRDIGSLPRGRGGSFLGVPISIRGEVYGSLYMTEKEGAKEFDREDEEVAATLAVWAGIAIDNARIYAALSEREAAAEQALHRAETSVDITRAVGGETNVERLLGLIAKRARALVEARTLLVLLRRGDRLWVAAQAGHGRPEVERLVVPAADPVFQAAVEGRVPQRLARGSPPSMARVRERLGAETALVVPLLFRGRSVGALLALDREIEELEFDDEDLYLLDAFAASAATAVATAQAVESDLLLHQVRSGEQERQRWARELHDDTLQALAAIRITLATALQSDAPDRAERIAAAAEQTVDQLEGQINELSRLINDLRPASLERLGFLGALEALVEECGARGDLDATADIEFEAGLSGEEERVVYRLAQEALNNAAKHSSATRASLCARLADGTLRVVIEDDGIGFDPNRVNHGRGLGGMRERVALLGGELEVSSEPEHGTRITATVPVRGR